MAHRQRVVRLVDHYLGQHRRSRTYDEIARELKALTGMGSDTAISGWRKGLRIPAMQQVTALRLVVGCKCPEYGEDAIDEAYRAEPKETSAARKRKNVDPTARRGGEPREPSPVIAEPPDVVDGEAEWSRLRSRLIGASAVNRTTAQPDIIPSMDRLGALSAKLRGGLDEVRSPLALIGEGGLGKSVLLGQLFDFHASRHGDGSTWFLPCGRIPVSARLDTYADIDRELGALALGTRDCAGADRLESWPLTELLTRVPAEERPLVLVDTVDLVVREDNADHVSDLLGQLARSARLAWTCREQEWNDYLKHETGTVETLYHMPTLERPDIEAWALAYVEAADIATDVGRAFVESLVGPQSPAGVLEICASPLRLAMACEIYAVTGTIPENLTVTELYAQYWDRVIAEDRHGRRTAAARAQEAIAEAISEQMWIAGGARLAVEIGPDTVSGGTALNRLLSAGVVTSVGGRLGFFHQTYAEFAIARYLARAGSPEDLRRLHTALTGSGVSAFSAVARHMLMLDCTEHRYTELAASVPDTTVEGVRLHFAAAFNRGSPELVAQVHSRIRAISRPLLLACVDVLATATSKCAAAAFAVVIDCLAGATASEPTRPIEAWVHAAGKAASTLYGRMPASGQARGLAQALDGLLYASGGFDKGVRSSVLTRFVTDVLAGGMGDESVRVLIDRYAVLPEATRARVLAALTILPRERGRDESLLAVAVEHPCPSGAVDDLVTLVSRNWSDPDMRAALGWSSWKTFLDLHLKTRWDACQVRVVSALCVDPGMATEVLDTLLGAGKPVTDRYTNVAKFIADQHRDLVIRGILDLDTKLEAAQVGLACTVLNFIADQLTAEERATALSLLSDWLPSDERRVRPTMIKVSDSEVPLLQQRIAELHERAATGGPARGVIRSAVDTFMNVLPDAVLSEIADGLRPLVAGDDPEDRWRRARLDGLIAAYSDAARERAAAEIRQGGVRGATEAANGVVTSAATRSGTTLGESEMDWMAGLLDSPHANAVRVLATQLHKLNRIRPLSDKHVPLVVRRLSIALMRDDPQTVGALLDLLTDAERAGGLPKQTVLEVMGTFRREVESRLSPETTPKRRSDLPALFNQYKKSVSALGLRHLTADGELERLVTDLLRTIDIGRIAGRTERILAHLLILASERDPRLLGVLERLWPGVSDANKAAIAECFTVKESGSLGVRSRALAARPDCPTDVKNEIYRKFP
ncbi:hypothetical protein ACWDNI_23660 [Nocardia niigatensis]